MVRSRIGWLLVGLALLDNLCGSSALHAAVPNSLILNEANTISGDKYLDATKSPARGDSTFGRVQGNGQNWLEFLVVQGDQANGGAFKNTLDLRGWKINWYYDKNDPTAPNNFGAGVIQFSNDPAWAAIPRGTILTISEWQDAWYSKTPDPLDTSTGTLAGTPRNGLPRMGGVDGLGVAKGAPYDASVNYKLGAQMPGAPADPHILSTDFSWNPAASNPLDTGDWHMNVSGGEGPTSSENQGGNLLYHTKYFTFSGSVTKDGVTSKIGTEDGGLFVVNNDNWKVSINDNTSANGGAGNVIQGPIGEPFSGKGVSSVENVHFENNAFSTTNSVRPTLDDFLQVGNSSYAAGSTNTYGLPDKWSGGSFTQDVSPLRSWLLAGDANLDGKVDAADYSIWRNHKGIATNDWRDGDFNGDGMVDATDYNIWRANFGAISPGSGSAIVGAAVPEPHVFALLTLTAMGGVASRGRSLSRRL